MLAYIAWHRPVEAAGVHAYEQALERFHRSLAHAPPSGFAGSACFRAPELPWLELAAGVGGAAGPGGGGGACGTHGDEGTGGSGGRTAGYEDWYLLESWWALGVLEEAAVSRGHASRHDAVASRAAGSLGAVYRLSEGHAGLEHARVGAWVDPAGGQGPPTLAGLLGDGMDREAAGLWRRCLSLGPAPEYCLLAPEAPAGVRPERLPAGWSALVGAREPVW